MEFVVAVLGFPALLAVLAVGAGLLADRVAGGVLPGVLVPPVGLALLVSVAELCAYTTATAPLTPVALAVVAVVGYAVGRARLRAMRPDLWAVGAAAAVYLVAIAPVLLSGRVTVAGYLLDTTVAFHLSGSDYLVAHARDFGRVPESAYRTMLENYFGNQYPTGGQTLLGGTGRLVGVDRIWLYQPFVSILLATCVGPLYHLARTVTVPRPLAAAGAALAATPALVYAYAQMGAIKELTALPFVLLLGSALVLLPRLLDRGPRAAVVPAAIAAAGVGAIGFAFLPWVGATALAGVVLIVVGDRRDLRNPRRLAGWAAVLAAALVLLALPTFGPAGDSAKVAKSFNTGITDPGNLLQPLHNAQIFGVWLDGTHRIDPQGKVGQTYILIGMGVLAALLGCVFLVRRRRLALALFVGVMGVVWFVLTRRGAEWTDAKLLVITSPMVMLLVLLGVESLRRGERQVEAALLGGLIAFGVLASNAYTYHDTNLQPTDRYRELMDVGERFAGLTPTLTPEFDEFYFYALPDMAADGPGNSQRTARIAALRDGTPAAYGASYDLDQLPPASIQHYRAIVSRRRPDTSRPPANFRLVEHGDYYDVWRRSSGIVIGHVPAGAALDATSRVACSSVRRLAMRARTARGQLAYAARPRTVAVTYADLARIKDRPVSWGAVPGAIALATPGAMDIPVRMPETGRYRLWLGGDFGRPVVVSVDRSRVGQVEGQSGNDGNYAQPFDVELTAGRHVIHLYRGGGSLAPGNGTPSRLTSIVLEPERVPAEAARVRTVPLSDWRSLCGRRVDWVEAIR